MIITKFGPERQTQDLGESLIRLFFNNLGQTFGPLNRCEFGHRVIPSRFWILTLSGLADFVGQMSHTIGIFLQDRSSVLLFDFILWLDSVVLEAL